ncbi:MAG: class I SAM-dependent methyltransferase [Thermoleophilia bacterium]
MLDVDNIKFEKAKCAICDGDNAEKLFSARDKFHNYGGRFTVKRCRDCGLVYMDPRPTEDTKGKFYDDEYTFKSDKPSQESSHYLPVIEELKKMKPGVIHDVGTGNSQFLPMMRDLGWDVGGNEVDASLVEFFRKKHQIDIQYGDLKQARHEAKSVDVVTIMGVLEHTPDPKRLLEEVNRILKDDGKLILYCFNRNYEAALLGRYWLGYDTPRHLYSFSEKTLTRLLKETGFTVCGKVYSPVTTIFQSATWMILRLRNAITRSQRSTIVMNLPKPLQFLSMRFGRVMARLGTSPAVYLFCKKDGQ